MNKLFQHIGLFSFGVYLCFVCVFYQERTLFLDNAFQVFLMIVEGDIAVNAHRWPAVIVRLIPYSLIQIGAPLKIVLLFFSMSYWIYHFVIFCILRYKLRERSLALLQLATVTVPIIHSFFWCNSEQNLAVSLLVLTLALFKQGRYVWTGILCFILLWLHPLVFLPFGFIMLLYVAGSIAKHPKLDMKCFEEMKYPLVFGVVFTVMYVLKTVYIKNWYDNIKATNFQQNLSTYSFDLVEVFKPFFFENSFVFPLIAFTALLCLIIKKRFLKAGLWFVFMMGYLTVLHISREASFLFYDEVNYLILFFGGAYILMDFLKEFSSWVLKVLYVLILILVLFNWVSTSDFYCERIDWYKNAVEDNDRKVMDFKAAPRDTIIMPWASMYETLIISSLDKTESGKKSSTFVYTQQLEKYNLVGSDTLFYGDFKNYSLDEVNGRYFDLESKAYRKE